MKTVPGWTEMIRTDGNKTWKVNRDCVYLNGERFINGVELGSPSSGHTRFLVEDVRIAIQLRDEFDEKFPEAYICPLTEPE